jgi:DNA-binding transcriptional LysR family regulator
MLHIEDLQLISTLARSPSLSAAARTLNVTPAALSTRLKKLEALLQLNLAVRSAHKLSLTDEGEQLAKQATLLLGQIEALPDSISRMSKSLSGNLRVTAPFGFGRQHVAPAVIQFKKAHPAIRPTLELVESPWPDKRDADVVIHIGEVRDSSWVAYLLARNARWLCASPAYLRAHGQPKHPRDLAQHSTLCIRENDEDASLWHYRKGSAKSAVRVAPQMESNDGEVVRSWALAGMGIVLRSQWDVHGLIAQGKLVRLLPDWHFDSADVVALVPHRQGNTVRVQAFVKHLQGIIAATAISD